MVTMNQYRTLQRVWDSSMLSLFNSLTSKAYFVLIIGLCSLFGIRAFAQEMTISHSADNYVVIGQENAKYFLKVLTERTRNSSEQVFWEEVADYFKKLPDIVNENDQAIIKLDDLIFPMRHDPLTRLIVRNFDLLRSDLLLGQPISNKVIDQMILRDSVVIIADYYEAMLGKSFPINGILKTIGVAKYKKDASIPTIGKTVHAFDINEKHLGNKLLNTHPLAQDWIALVGNISLKDGLDLAFNEQFVNESRHPLLGGSRKELYALFADSASIYGSVYKFFTQMERDALASFQVGGNISSADALSVYLCHYHLKLDQSISEEFKFFCDFALFKAFYSNKINLHPYRSLFEGLNGRYDLHF